MSARNDMRRAAWLVGAVVPALAALPVHATSAQERLVGGSTVIVGAMIDQAGFGSGLPFASAAGLGTAALPSLLNPRLLSASETARDAFGTLPGLHHAA